MKITIVTICLNAAKYLAGSMVSVLGQDHADLEYLLVDGCSTDGSLDLIRAAAIRDPRITWSSSPDGGIADAMNKGLALASGEVIAFLHADDSYVAPDVLSQVERVFAAAPDRLWATGGIREVDEEGKLLREISVRCFSRRRLLRNNIILHPATFVRRQAFEQVGGFDPKLRFAMDYDLWLRLAELGPPLELGGILANFRVHPGSLSSTHRKMAIEEEYRLRRRHLRGPLARAGHLFYHLWRCCRVPASR